MHSECKFKKMIDFLLFYFSTSCWPNTGGIEHFHVGDVWHLIVDQTCKISAAPEVFFFFLFFLTLPFFQGIMNRIVFKAKPGRRPTVSQPALVHVIGCGDWGHKIDESMHIVIIALSPLAKYVSASSAPFLRAWVWTVSPFLSLHEHQTPDFW